MKINFYSEDCNYLPKERMKIRRWIAETIHTEGYKGGEISYIYCSGDYHLNVNRTYLGHDYRTDVITFDYSDLEGRGVVSGDIFIDHETVADNAAEWGTDPREEELRVIIHGVLHLCGYKDKAPEEEKQMRAKENFYLAVWRRKK
ncbi:MAG: rRNA maturation RNase YbeY [Tidjanibacter sp.]|nr:rRNA maturation RNase YbeY [Tidjanibacter sp.]